MFFEFCVEQVYQLQCFQQWIFCLGEIDIGRKILQQIAALLHAWQSNLIFGIIQSIGLPLPFVFEHDGQCVAVHINDIHVKSSLITQKVLLKRRTYLKVSEIHVIFSLKYLLHHFTTFS